MSTEDADRADPAGERPAAPALRVVSGSPTAEELAAITAVVLAAASGADAPAPAARRGGWNDPAARHRRELIPGPNAWRSSAW